MTENRNEIEALLGSDAVDIYKYVKDKRSYSVDKIREELELNDPDAVKYIIEELTQEGYIENKREK